MPAQQRQRIVNEILRQHVDMVTAGKTLDETLTQLVAGACRLSHTPLDRGSIRVIDPVTSYLKQDIRANGTILHPSPMSRAERRGITGRAISKRQTQVVQDVNKDSDYVAIDREIRSELAVPLVTGSRCWGVLNLESYGPNYFTQDLILWIEILASHAVSTIQADMLRAQSERARITPQDQLVSDNLQADLTQIAADAVFKLRYREASIEILGLTPEEDALVTLAFAAADQRRVLPGRFAPDSTVAWKAVRQRIGIEYAELRPNDPQTNLGDSRCAVALPLCDSQGFVIGVLSIEAPEPHALDGTRLLLDTYRTRAEATLCKAEPKALRSATSIESVMAEIRRQTGHLVDPQNLTRFYQLVLRRIAQMIGDPDVQVAIAYVEQNTHSNQNELTITVNRTYNYQRNLPNGWSWPIERGISGRAVREQRSILVLEVNSDPDYYQYDPLVRSELAVPILRGVNAIGAIIASSPNSGTLTKVHEKMLQAVSDTVATALARAEQIHRGTVAQEHLDLIHQTNLDIEKMLAQENINYLRQARQRVLADLVRAAMELTGSEYGAIASAIQVPAGPSRTKADASTELVLTLVEPETAKVNVKKHKHWATTVGVTGEAFRTGKTCKYLNIRQAPDFYSLLGDDIISELAVPIRSGERVVGVLNLESVEERAYSPEQIARVELLASQIANVLSAADLRLLRKQLEHLLRFENDVMVPNLYDETDFDNSKLQHPFVRAALELTSQPDGYASLWLLHGEHLHRHAYYTTNTKALGSTPVETTEKGAGGIVGKALTFEVPILVLDCSETRWDKIMIANWSAAASDLAIPLIDHSRRKGERGRVLGVLNVESPRQVDFSDRDIEILELLAQAAVAAIRNRDIYRGRVMQLRDMSHTLGKVLWPLRIDVEGLRRQAASNMDQYTLEELRKTVSNVVGLTNLTTNVVDWFHELVPNEHGITELKLEQVLLSDLLDPIIDSMNILARDVDKQLKLRQLSNAVRNTKVYCSPKLIRSALFLLIENALRYGPECDTVYVRVKHLPAGDARIEVLDHGSPIPRDERDYLFDPGFRGSAGRAVRDQEGAFGSGIGLDHVRRIVVLLHQGRVGYERTRAGNVFYMELPTRKRRSSLSSKSGERKS